MVRWSGEVQVNVSGVLNRNLSLTLVVVKLVAFSVRDNFLSVWQSVPAPITKKIFITRAATVSIGLRFRKVGLLSAWRFD